MSPELDEKLVRKYPKIFKNRYADMRTTAMCWGLECGDGWYNIIDALCANIQHHIDWKRKDRAQALRYNRALKRAINGDESGLIKHYSYGGKVSDWSMTQAEEAIERQLYRKVPDKIYQVVATQVKEKFGTLRFYYDGGDDRIRGMEAMAESMSARTCETCGNPGKLFTHGWRYTACPNHAREEDLIKDGEQDEDKVDA